MAKYIRVVLSKFDKKFLELSWDWLNDIEIKHLTDTSDFTREQQEEWFGSLNHKCNYLIWGINANSIPIGACGLKNITEVDCEYWGYIGNKQYWGKGIGTQVMQILEDKARSLNKSSVWLKVIKENVRALSLYKRLGYKPDLETESVYIMRKTL